MNKFKEMPFKQKNESVDSKPLGRVEINGVEKEVYISNGGAVPDLYVEGISEPIIKADLDFIPGEGWKVVDLVENPELQSVLATLSDSDYTAYVDEVNSIISFLNKTKPNG